MKSNIASKWLWLVIVAAALGYGAKGVFAQTSPAGVSYVPLIGITSVPVPLALPKGPGLVSFTYRVTNPGVVPLADVTVSDDKCSAMSGKLGDVNGNGLLDPNEVWIYSCTMVLAKTATNTVTVTAYANGLSARDTNTITVDVAGTAAATSAPGLPNEGSGPVVPGLPSNGTSPNTLNITFLTWEILGGILLALVIIFLFAIRKKE